MVYSHLLSRAHIAQEFCVCVCLCAWNYLWRTVNKRWLVNDCIAVLSGVASILSLCFKALNQIEEKSHREHTQHLFNCCTRILIKKGNSTKSLLCMHIKYTDQKLMVRDRTWCNTSAACTLNHIVLVHDKQGVLHYYMDQSSVNCRPGCSFISFAQSEQVQIN